MDTQDIKDRLARIETKLDAALETVATNSAYIRIGAAIVALLAAQLVRIAWK